MTRIISLILVIAGLVLLAYGVNASESISSDFSRFFTGSPTDRTIWFLFAGVAALALGASGLLRGIRTI